MGTFKLLGTALHPLKKLYILEQIKKYIYSPSGFMQIISLNPEIIMIAKENESFKRIIETSQIQLIDGVGVATALRLQGKSGVERITGVDMMEDLLKLANNLSLRVLLIGGRSNLALHLADCYTDAYPKAKFKGIEGFQNINNQLQTEEDTIFSIVAEYKPHFLFVAFGSPEQEIWLERHKKQLTGIIGMGVGGAFDFASGKIARAPELTRKLGLEWFFRLLIQPWRWRRQLRLIKFSWLVFLEKIKTA